MAKIEITDLCKDFTVEGIKTVHAVKHASLTVNDGEVVVIIGPSGSGKSTLLRSVNKLEEPTSGSIRIDGIEVTDPKTDLRKIREEVGMVFQRFNLFAHKTILETQLCLCTRYPVQRDQDLISFVQRLWVGSCHSSVISDTHGRKDVKSNFLCM